MAAPTLNAYEYQFTDGGVLLNRSGTLPFVDVTSIQGLDLPTIDDYEADFDGRHGGYIYARYVKSRTIIIDGILYASAATADVAIEALIANFVPREDDAPFYYRGAGIAQRYIMCKPIGFNFNIDNLRNYGACQIQIQLKAGDPLKYADNADVVVTSGTTGTVTNDGNAETFGVFDLSGAASEVSIVKVSTGETVTVTYTTDADDAITIDFKKRACYVNGVRNSSYLTSLGWWSFNPASSTDFKILSVGVDTMVNGNCEANFTGSYAVGTNWTGTQQFTGDKHSGSKSLKMTRKNKTAGGGTVTVPTGVTGQAAGTYTASVWLKGTMPHANISVYNAAVAVATLTLVPVSSTTWQKFQLTYTLATTGGDITFVISDTGEAANLLAKNKVLLMDDFSIRSVNSGVTCTAHTKDGWL